MGQTLSYGVYLPNEGERNCYAGLASNWQILNTAVGAIAEKAPLVHTHTVSQITDFPAYGTTAGTICEGNDSRLSDARTPLAHTHTKSDVTDLLNSNFIPSANNSYDLGSSSYQWNNVYAKGYYYNGTAWGLGQANTWTGNNIFNKRADPTSVTSVTDTTLAFNGLFNTIFLNTRGSSNRPSYGSFLFVGYGTTSGADNYGQIQLLRSTDKRGDTNDGYVPDTSFKLWRVAPHSLIMDSMEAVRVTNDGTENSLKPITNNATDLGTPTNAWKTLNGINPGALSLPDIYDSYDVVTTNWSTAYNQPNDLKINGADPSYPGWLFIRLDNCTAENDFVIVRYFHVNATNLTFFGSFIPTASSYVLSVPIQAGITTKVWVSKIPTTCKYYACLGTVK